MYVAIIKLFCKVCFGQFEISVTDHTFLELVVFLMDYDTKL